MLVVSEEKDVLVHEAEISVVSIHVERRKEKVVPKPRVKWYWRISKLV